MSKLKKNTKGITLIALVVTIIVLILLAGISITMLTGQNGILTRAREAKENTGTTQTEELVKLSISDAITQGLGTVTETNLVKALDTNLGSGNYQLSGNETGGWKIRKDGKIYTVDGNGSLQMADSKVQISMEITYANTTQTEGEKISKVVDDSVPIPKDFYYVGGTKSTGVVISDNSTDENKGVDETLTGNQFVWVPVNQNQKLKITLEGKEDITNVTLKNEFGDIVLNESTSGKNYNKELELDLNGKYTLTVTTASGAVEEEVYKVSSLYRQIYQFNIEGYKDNTETQTSVNTYGGFYIGRYEGGDGVATQERIDSSGDSTLVSKKDVYIYNNVTFNEAKAKAESMYSNITSKLISGAGWDRTLNWIVETGNKTEEEVFENSSSWGNYNDSTGSAQTNSGMDNMNFKTGRNEAWKANNIYDLAGNVNEWTDEVYISKYANNRGGNYYYKGSAFPVFSRSPFNVEFSQRYIGFRVALYL